MSHLRLEVEDWIATDPGGAEGQQVAEGGKDQAILLSVRRLFRPDDVSKRGDRNPNAVDRDGLCVALQIRLAARAVRDERDVQIAQVGGQVPRYRYERRFGRG